MERPAVLRLAVFAALAASGSAWGQAASRAAAAPVPAHDIRPGPGVTAVKTLSAYLPVLAGTPGDTPVFVLEGTEPGGTAFLAGGTHANEIAGSMAALVLVEHVRVLRGRLIVVPYANNSATTWPDPKRPCPERITLRTPGGDRRFACGSRSTRPEHQGAPDPSKFMHSPDSEPLDGIEARNLDRAYPGRADGTLTERVAAAVVRLLDAERVDVAFDLHESGPESRLAWMVVAHPKNVDLAAAAVIALDSAGLPMKLEQSSETFRGLSHREWGDATKARAFLFETANPAMGAEGKRGDPVSDPAVPLARRVAVHLATVQAVLEAYNDEVRAAGGRVVLGDVPGVDEMVRKGVGAFLR